MAYKNKIEDTGNSIIDMITGEKDEVSNSLKIIDFQQKLQKDNSTYLGYASYDKVKLVYDRI